jgi:hypothetical protein
LKITVTISVNTAEQRQKTTLFGRCFIAAIGRFSRKHARQTHEYEGKWDEAKKKYHGDTTGRADADAAAEGGAVRAVPRRRVHLRDNFRCVRQQAAFYKRWDATIRESPSILSASFFAVVA